jgi:hypothetical protein
MSSDCVYRNCLVVFLCKGEGYLSINTYNAEDGVVKPMHKCLCWYNDSDFFEKTKNHLDFSDFIVYISLLVHIVIV